MEQQACRLPILSLSSAITVLSMCLTWDHHEENIVTQSLQQNDVGSEPVILLWQPPRPDSAHLAYETHISLMEHAKALPDNGVGTEQRLEKRWSFVVQGISHD
jgi:hypothetical protein